LFLGHTHTLSKISICSFNMEVLHSGEKQDQDA
jgi:hypothetical protein